MYIRPMILSSFGDDQILGEDRVAFADTPISIIVPAWTHYGTWSNSPIGK